MVNFKTSSVFQKDGDVEAFKRRRSSERVWGFRFGFLP